MKAHVELFRGVHFFFPLAHPDWVKTPENLDKSVQYYQQLDKQLKAYREELEGTLYRLDALGYQTKHKKIKYDGTGSR